MKKGKLIVLDGTDGSGKATQTKLLQARLKKEGYRVQTLDFPQYEKNFFGGLIGECLAGEHGDFVSIDPYIGSTLYAADRFESKDKIMRWLKVGCVVVLDRYVSSNQIHQGGKITDAKKRKKFLEWLEKMEYGVFGIPRPDGIIYLDVPVALSQKLLASKGQKEKKTYLKKRKTDVVEGSQKYLDDSRQSALLLVKKQNRWLRVECAKKDEMLSREVVAEKVWDQVKKIL
ncbi:MAG: thymidylate kinase [Candidatus Moraniibacteriota bacterium]